MPRIVPRLHVTLYDPGIDDVVLLSRQVLSMTSDEVFRAELQLYNRPPEPPPPSFVDLELAAQLGGARLLFTNRFVTDVLVGHWRGWSVIPVWVKVRVVSVRVVDVTSCYSDERQRNRCARTILNQITKHLSVSS